MKRRADEVVGECAKNPVNDKNKAAKSKKAVVIYIATLFAAVIFFILLSYLIQQRNNSQNNKMYAQMSARSESEIVMVDRNL